MAGKLTFSIKGAREMEKLLLQLGPRLAAKAGDQSLRAGAKPIVDAAKRLVPVDTGKLRRSITARISRAYRANQRIILIGFTRPRSAIAHLVEFGTVKMRAQPFMRPALDTQAKNALTEMGRVLAVGIEKVAGELRKRR